MFLPPVDLKRQNYWLKFVIQPCIKAWDIWDSTLIFVRRGVDYCNAVARDIVALLGRFLPRLGPLATASGPFFIRLRRDTAAVRRRGFPRAAAPAFPDRRPGGRTSRSVRSGARPYRAR